MTDNNTNETKIPLSEVDPEVLNFINKIEGKSQKENKQEKIEIPADKTFNENQGSVNDLFKDSIVRKSDIVVSEMDKTLFIKALMNDTPVELEIKLMNGQFNLKIRARTMYEQQLVFELMKSKKSLSIPEYVSELQKYSACFMLRQVGDNLVDFSVNEKDGTEENIKKLTEYADNYVKKLSQPKWALILNGLIIFENKCASMLEECANGNFWNPVG